MRLREEGKTMLGLSLKKKEEEKKEGKHLYPQFYLCLYPK